MAAFKFKVGDHVKSSRGNIFYISKATLKYNVFRGKAAYQVENLTTGHQYVILAIDAHRRWKSCNETEIVLYRKSLQK